jgi:hypothetical protein
VVGFQAPPVWKVVFSFLLSDWLFESVAWSIRSVANPIREQELDLMANGNIEYFIA